MSGTAPCPGTTRLSLSSAETVAALFIIQPNLCLVVSRNAGLHKLRDHFTFDVAGTAKTNPRAWTTRNSGHGSQSSRDLIVLLRK